jgi:hypothetical protein
VRAKSARRDADLFAILVVETGGVVVIDIIANIESRLEGHAHQGVDICEVGVALPILGRPNGLSRNKD